ncbi:MAG: hypothetical protein ACP5EQ_07555 [Candidatus Cloacimonadia bacterium]
MSISYCICADVVDIKEDCPLEDDIFFVDTNVWFWLTYTKASQSASPVFQYQYDEYPNYVNTALFVGSQLLPSTISLIELAHLIEKTERELYMKDNTKIGLKEFRHHLEWERKQVAMEIETAWEQVKGIAQPVSCEIDNEITDSIITRFQNEKMDAYDFLILESMRCHGVVKIITDDGDFATISGIQVFTANHNVIETARKNDKLILR